MRALNVARLDSRRQNYDAVNASLALPLPRDMGTDPSLRLLFRPSGDEMGAFGNVASIRNMASALGPFAAGFYRSNNNGGAARPLLLRDAYGPYWNFTSSAQRFEVAGGTPLTTTAIPWQTGAGHVPGTIASVFMLTAATSGEQYLFFIGGNSASTCGMGIGFSSGSVVTGKIYTRTTRTISTSAISLNQPYAAIFTTRTTTDHEVLCRNLITGAVLSATSALDSGSATGLPISIAFGSQYGSVSFLDRARIYLGAFWDRGFTNAELNAWAAAPLALLRPRVPGFRFDGAATAVVRGMRVRILG